MTLQYLRQEPLFSSPYYELTATHFGKSAEDVAASIDATSRKEHDEFMLAHNSLIKIESGSYRMLGGDVLFGALDAVSGVQSAVNRQDVAPGHVALAASYLEGNGYSHEEALQWAYQSDNIASLGAMGVTGAIDMARVGRITRPAGTLTPAERAEIQAIADKYDTTIDIVGSRAAGNGRNINSNFPKGKGAGTRSDIDFRIDTKHPQVDSLIEELKRVGNGVGSADKKYGTDQRQTYPPFIRINPTTRN
jgi:hypothetical protein